MSAPLEKLAHAAGLAGIHDKVMRGEWCDLFDHALCKAHGVEELADVFKRRFS